MADDDGPRFVFKNTARTDRRTRSLIQGWPEPLGSAEAERHLLERGPWSEVMPYFFAVDHRDRVGQGSPLFLSELQLEIARQIDEALACEIDYLAKVARGGRSVYVENLLERLGGRSGKQAVEEGVFKPFEIGLQINVLKSRRGGSSTFFLCAALRATLVMPGYSAISWAETDHSMGRIFRLQRYATERWREDIELNIEELGFIKPTDDRQEFLSGSSHIAKTVGSSTRGDKFDFLHLSEYAHYTKRSDVQQSLLVARPHAWVVRETTANGQNFFYDDWKGGRTPAEVREARDSERYSLLDDWNGQYNIFFPWWRDPGLTLPTTSEEAQAIDKSLTLYEMQLNEATNGRLSHEHIKFRREALRKFPQTKLEGLTPEQFFDQEYPWNPESAFQNTSKPVFDPDSVAHQLTHAARVKAYVMFSDVKRPEIVNSGPIVIYEPPKHGSAYVLAADVSYGVEEDFSELSIFDRTDGTRLVEVMNMRTNRMHPSVVAWYAVVLAYLYNDAYIVAESMGGGIALNDTVYQKLNYPNIHFRHHGHDLESQTKLHSKNPKLGVWISHRLKVAAVDRLNSRLRTSVIDQSLVLRSRHGVNQLSGYIYDGRSWRGRDGWHDDYVSMLLVLMMADPHIPPVESQVNTVKESRGLMEVMEGKREAYEVVWDHLLRSVGREGRRNRRRARVLGMAHRDERG